MTNTDPCRCICHNLGSSNYPPQCWCLCKTQFCDSQQFKYVPQPYPDHYSDLIRMMDSLRQIISDLSKKVDSLLKPNTQGEK